ncbi:hypothetical protein J5690_03105 [bacterium]|nr:hypothetical protein [bacterium]
MKKFLVCAAMIAAMFLTVSCGGGSSSGGGESYYQECSYGDYVCKYGDSYYCGYSGNDLRWELSQYCSYGCDSWTGKCADSQSSDSECSSGQYKCDGSYSYSCYNGFWSYDDYCDYGCNTSTGKCNSSSNDDNNSSLNLSCTSIYNCMVDCGQDGTCQQNCYDNGSATGQSKFEAMLNCWNDKCEDAADDEFENCIYSNCAKETKDCGFTVPDGNNDPTNPTDPSDPSDPSDECAEGLFYYQGTCQSPWGKKWIVTFVSAKVTEKNDDDEAWDALGGLPDLFAVVKINGKEVFRTSEGSDSTAATWNEDATIDFSAKTDKITYCLYDGDAVGGDTSSDLASSNDEVGCWDHEFEWFSLDKVTITSDVVDHFDFSLEPAW